MIGYAVRSSRRAQPRAQLTIIEDPLQAAFQVARVLGPAMGGALFQQVAPGSPYVVAAALSIAALLCAAPGRRIPA